MIQDEIDNFKYTLIDLISIYSKYGCKIKKYFLSLFVEKINEKKYFDLCIFILTYEFYEINNDEVFDILFNYLNNISIEYFDNNQIKQFFIKLLDFDKIYLLKDIKKATKKEYSKLIRNIIKKTIEFQLNECYTAFLDKLKQLKKDLENNNNMNNSFYDIKVEEYYNEGDKNSYKISFDEINKINDDNNNNLISIKSRNFSLSKNIDDISNDTNNNVLDFCENNLEMLILIYKNLKNLYISINEIKKKFIELCSDKINSIKEFFNELFNILCEIYQIKEDNQKLKFKFNEKEKKEVIIAELIKCLCIRFLDDLYFEENITKIKDEELKKQKNDEKNSRKASSESISNSFNSCKSTIKSYPYSNNKNISIKSDSSSNNIINDLNSLNSSQNSSFISNKKNNNKNITIEGVLNYNMKFFDNIILSQYTFKSLFLMLFRETPNYKKLKIIKSDKNIKNILLISEKNFNKTRYILRIVISLFENQIKDGYDTFLMPKINLIEYCYNIFHSFLKNMLNLYLNSEEEKKKKKKPMINDIFADKRNYYNIQSFYESMIYNNIINFNSIKNSTNNQNDYLIKEKLDKLLNQVQNDIIEFINKTIFELVDPFYFKLLIEIFFQNDINNEFVINAVIIIIDKLITRLEKDKNRIIEINCKNLLILIYKMYFFVNKRNILLYWQNEAFLKKLFFFLSKFLVHSNILYTKILFPIEDSRGKLLIEILYELIFEMYLDFLKNPKIPSLELSFLILKKLFDEKIIKRNLLGHIINLESSKNNRKEEIEIYSPFYIMDLLSYFLVKGNINEKLRISDDIIINRQFYDLKYYIIHKYKDEIDERKEIFSVCILFCIKIILSINELKEYFKNKIKNINISLATISDEEEINNTKKYKYENSNLINNGESIEDSFLIELKKQFLNICKNILKIHIEYTSLNPFKSIGYYAKNLYEYFREYIIDKFSITKGDPNNKIDELIKNLNKYKKDIKYFERVVYIKD